MCGAGIGTGRACYDAHATQPAIHVQHREHLACIHVVDVHEDDDDIWLDLPDPRICSFDRLHHNDVVVVVVNKQPGEQLRPKRIVADRENAGRDVLMT